MDDERCLRWRWLLQWQPGAVSRQQALDAGLTRKAIDWQLHSGAWRRLHRGIYATFTGDLPREAKLRAAALRAGSGAMLSHETAAEIHGFTDRPSNKIHLSLPAERRPGQDRTIRGLFVHRSRCLMPEWQPPWQLPRTTVEDTAPPWNWTEPRPTRPRASGATPAGTTPTSPREP